MNTAGNTALAGWIMGIKTNEGSEFLRRMSVAMMFELHMSRGYQNYSNFVPEVWTHIPWVDQYNGTELNHKTLEFFSNKGDSWWSTVLLGTHVYNDITPYQFDLGLLKLNTTLYNYNN